MYLGYQMKPEEPKRPTFAEAARFWLKLGLISFGGPAGQIAIMHAELVERRKWISEARFLHALNFCMLLPGPEAQQLATYLGWLLHKTCGGIVAGTLFVLPSALLLWGLSYVYVVYGTLPWVAALFFGLKPAVLAIIAAAIFRIGGKILTHGAMWALAALAFVAISFLHLPFPVIVIAGGLVGLIGGTFWPGQFLVIGTSPKNSGAALIGDNDAAAEHTKPTWSRAIRVAAACLTLWWLPVLAAGFWLGWNDTVFRQGVFFSKAAMVTFGGAYAVLPYVSQQAVGNYEWLTAGQMLDGMGLAETTPGPLIIVLQFVGFLGAWHHPGSLPSLVAATLGAAITTWTTFLPSFLWIFLGAPHLENLRGNKNLSAALSAITATVVGVMLSLAFWFGAHVIYPQTVDWFALTLTVIALFGLLRLRWPVIPVIVGAALAGFLWMTGHQWA